MGKLLIAVVTISVVLLLALSAYVIGL